MPEDPQFAFDFNPPASALPELWTPDDIYLACDAATISRFAEDRRVERKRVEVAQRDFAAYLSMWSNTQPSGGVMFIGVGDDGSMLGCKHSSTDHLNEFETARKLCPDARFELKRVPITDRNGEPNFIIAVRVLYRADKLVECHDGRAFVREGSEKRQLLETEKRELRLNRGELDCETEKVAISFPDDFDQKLMARFRDNYVAKRSLTPRYQIEDVLQLCKLGKRAGGRFEPNLACAILFAKDSREILPGAYIRVLRYEGTEERFGQGMNAVADRIFDGPLAQQVADAESFIGSQIRTFTRLGADGRFLTKPEFPHDVWLEAVVNAAVHRSYNLRHMNIFVKMFDNKLVVESPGSFFPPTTGSTVYEAHNPRNPNLMWAMYYFDFVQCAYEGTRRMRAAMQDASLPEPIFAEAEGGAHRVVVTLKNNVEHRKQFVRTEAMPNIDPIVYEKLSEAERLLVNYCAEGRRITVKDAQDVLGSLANDWRAARQILGELEKKRLFMRPPGKERDRHRMWYLRPRRAVKGPTPSDKGWTSKP
jgi:ATP-dependent DNA helicase RecG